MNALSAPLDACAGHAADHPPTADNTAARADAAGAACSPAPSELRRFVVRVEERRERFLIAHVDAADAHAACEAAEAQARAMGWRAAQPNDCGAERLVFVTGIVTGRRGGTVEVPWCFDRLARQLAAAKAPAQPGALTVAERRAELAALAAAGLTLADCVAVFGEPGQQAA